MSPTEIEPQVQTLADYADGLATTVATAGDAPDQVRDALAAAVRAQQGQVAQVESASTAVVTYAQATCGVDLTTPTTGATTP